MYAARGFTSNKVAITRTASGSERVRECASARVRPASIALWPRYSARIPLAPLLGDNVLYVPRDAERNVQVFTREFMPPLHDERRTRVEFESSCLRLERDVPAIIGSRCNLKSNDNNSNTEKSQRITGSQVTEIPLHISGHVQAEFQVSNSAVVRPANVRPARDVENFSKIYPRRDVDGIRSRYAIASAVSQNLAFATTCIGIYGES